MKHQLGTTCRPAKSEIKFTSNRFDPEQKSALKTYARMLGARLTQLRLRRGLAQHELAKAIHCSTQLVSAWETGRRALSMHVRWLVVLSCFYGMTIAEVLDVDAAAKEPIGNHRACVPGNPAMCSECREIA